MFSDRFSGGERDRYRTSPHKQRIDQMGNRLVELRDANEVVRQHLHEWLLRLYFATLRDVNRFISTLAFQFSSFSVDGAFEVNPIDLIGLEVIPLYEPEVYKALQSSKEIPTAHKRGVTGSDCVQK